MYRFVITSLFIACSLSLAAQDKTLTDLKKETLSDMKLPKRDSGKLWTTGGTFTITIGQGSQKNWAAGGDDFSFSMNSFFGLWARYKKNRMSWDNSANFNYGFLNTTSQGTRKNDDRIDATTKLGYSLTEHVNVAVLANFQSQFSKGYKYSADGPRELLSNFMSPGYLVFSIGLDYKPVDGLSIFVSPITGRWIFVSDDSLSVKGSYGVDPGDHVKNEIGAFASITYNKKFNDKVSYIGKLDLFSNYKNHPENIDVLMNNMLAFQISKMLTANVGLDLIYDDDVKLFGPDGDSPGLQIKQMIGIGFTVKL